MQTAEDVQLIHDLINDYIKEKRTIIMAVVSAKNDYANQIILKKCREVDPKGLRTLGIITKPDFLEPDSENESAWIELAANKDIFFDLGWHMLKNRLVHRYVLYLSMRSSLTCPIGRTKRSPARSKLATNLKQRSSPRAAIVIYRQILTVFTLYATA